MKNLYSTFFSLLFILFSGSLLTAQSNFFTPVDSRNIDQPVEAVKNIKEMSVFRLNEQEMRTYLENAPMEFQNGDFTLPLEVPLPNGKTETFQLVETSNLSPELAAKFPDIKTNNVTLLLRQTQIVWSDFEEAFIARGTYEIYGRTNVYDINIHTTGAYANTMVEYNGEWKITRSVLSPLVKVLVHHQVADFAAWKSEFTAGASRRSVSGEIAFEFGTLHDDPKTVYVLSEWSSLEAFQNYFTGPETEKARRAAGVTGKPTLLILDTNNKH
jgi:quinol monooxygenase YgiN